LLKLAGAIRITSCKFGPMDTERGHEGVARIKMDNRGGFQASSARSSRVTTADAVL
jgi:hypothetical protein